MAHKLRFRSLNLNDIAGEAVNNTCLNHIRAAIDLTERMIEMADDVAENCEDDGALVVFSVIRDSAYKIRRIAEKEYEEMENNHGH